MIKTNKRRFIRNSTIFTLLTYFISFENIFASWPEELFNSRKADELIKLISSNNKISSSDKIHIKAPEIAENGAVVPITVSSDIDNVTQISILVDNNPSPLTSSFDINPKLEAYVSTRVKMAKSSNIIAILTTKEDGYFSAMRSIKVTIGGCGG